MYLFCLDNKFICFLTGNLNDWWEPEAAKTYLDKAKCIVDQYGGYKSDQVDLYLKGNVTQGENIADNGGIKMAYNAYCKLHL